MRQINIKNFVQAFKKLRLEAKIFFGLLAIAYMASLGFISQSTKNWPPNTLYITSRLEDCYKKQNRSLCLKQAASDIYQSFSLTDFQKAIKQNEGNESVFNTCHEASHYIGRIAYQQQKDIKTLFNQCEHICLDGCYHGAVEGYFIDKGINLTDENFQKVAYEVANICGKESDYEVPELYITCLHGLGHAVMFITDNELPNALHLCDALSGTNEQELCYTGALMANSDSRNSIDHPTKYLKADDPMYPCPILAQKHQKKCYEYNTLNFYHFTNYDWGETIKLCGQVPKDYRQGCYQTMGGDQVGFTDDVSKIKEACNEIPGDDFKIACIDGAESNLVMRYSSDFDKALQFCTILGGKYKEKCYKIFVRLLNRWSRSKEKKTTICLKIQEDRYKERCLASID